jgi:hypothetical protein
MAAVLFFLVLSWDGTTDEAACGGKPTVPKYPPAVPLIGGILAFEIFGGIALPGQIRKIKELDYPFTSNRVWVLEAV